MKNGSMVLKIIDPFFIICQTRKAYYHPYLFYFLNPDLLKLQKRSAELFFMNL